VSLEKVEVFDSAHDTELSVLHVIDEKMEPGLSAPLYKVMWKDYPDGFCNWEVRENMGRDVGKLDEYLKRKREVGDGMVVNPIRSELRNPLQVVQLYDDGSVAADNVDEINGGDMEFDNEGEELGDDLNLVNGGEEGLADQEGDEQDDGDDDDEEMRDVEGKGELGASLDEAEICQHCNEVFKSRGLLRHMATRHREEWLKLRQVGKGARKRGRSQPRRASMPAVPIVPKTAGAPVKRSRKTGNPPTRRQPSRQQQQLQQQFQQQQRQGQLVEGELHQQVNDDYLASPNRQELLSSPMNGEGLNYADLLVMVSSTKEWNMFSNELENFLDVVDTSLMEPYWRSVVERADYPGKTQKVDVALMINWIKVRTEKLKTLILLGKWPKACVLALICCHLLQPLCVDLHNLIDGIKTEVRKMLKRLERANVAQSLQYPPLSAYLLAKIDVMKQFCAVRF
jgi:hypothetical protein